MTSIALTLWLSLYDSDAHTPWSGDWDGVCGLLGYHTQLKDKANGAGFGPYALARPLGGPCSRHKGLPRPNPHRCDACVPSLTVAVYDADTGPLAPCLSALTSAGLAWFAYTTYSHTPERSAWRLVLPLSEPIPAERWDAFRRVTLSRYGIPADPAKCSGASHFYFMPSAPLGGIGSIQRGMGESLSVGPYATAQCGLTPVVAVRPAVGEEQDLGPYRAVLKERLRNLTPTKAGWLRRALQGKPLAEHGERNHAVTITSAVMVAALAPIGATPATVCALLKPSVEAAMDLGSTTDLDDLERMVLSIWAKNAQRRAEADELARELWGIKAAARAKPVGQ